MLNEDYIKKGKTDLLSTALIEDLSDKNLFDPIFIWKMLQETTIRKAKEWSHQADTKDLTSSS